MTTLFRFTMPNGRNLLTAATATAGPYTFLFLWLGRSRRWSLLLQDRTPRLYLPGSKAGW